MKRRTMFWVILSCLLASAPALAKALEVTTGYMPNLEVEIIEGANHLTALGDPAFLEGIQVFLDRQSAPALPADRR